MEGYLKDGDSITLEAFDHQVGGHSLLMKFGDRICKPLLPREQFFYESIPHEIRTFTPHYHGECMQLVREHSPGHANVWKRGI